MTEEDAESKPEKPQIVKLLRADPRQLVRGGIVCLTVDMPQGGIGFLPGRWVVRDVKANGRLTLKLLKN